MRTKPRTTFGTIISDKMNKTVVVGVTRSVPHPLYGKVVRKLSKFKAHDEKNEAKLGDVVKIVHTRPLSKSKSWRVAEIVERGEKSRALNQ